MVTIEELSKLEEGTIIYVAAPGRGCKQSWANCLSEETFIGIDKLRSGYFIDCSSGGYNFEYLRRGEALFLDKSEAEMYMEAWHIQLYYSNIRRLALEIDKLQQELTELHNTGPSDPDYLYHKRG